MTVQQLSSHKISLIQESGVVLEDNGASASNQEGGFNGLDCEDSLLDNDFTKQAEFSKFLGMPIEGFEEEIWALLRKLRKKLRRGTPSKGQKKIPLSSSLFERELRRLSYSVSCGGSSLLFRRSDKNNWELVLVN